MGLAVRRPAVAGTFYPGEPRPLRAQVDACLEAARACARPDLPPVKILLVPHAGYDYSGAVAAHGYARVAAQRGRVRRVLLLGPTHRVALRGIAVPTVDAFDTPLGRVPLDRAAIDRLADLPQVVADDRPHAAEHALEVQLPFLQAVLGDVAIVPMAVGHVSPAQVAEAIELLWGGDETLIVVSSDLSHFLPYAQARAVDADTVQRVLRLDPALDHEQACGATPLAAAITLARTHGLAPTLLDLRNSGDTAGDRSRVVGYASVAFAPPATGASAAPDQAEKADEAEDLAGADPALGRALTRRARNAIASALGLAGPDEPHHPALATVRATFVTLHRAGELRGCVGSLDAVRALEADVRHNARAAAFRDPRFEPVTGRELAQLDIEVSLLGTPRPIAARSAPEALARLQPGIDGVVLAWRGRRATFLPQVWAQLPRPEAFLDALRAKAGLPAGFWDAELTLSRYRVTAFGEAEHA
jgi:AmmeMemoRadiSam system protein B/AmmeMemoRadiSam system protein A